MNTKTPKSRTEVVPKIVVGDPGEFPVAMSDPQFARYEAAVMAAEARKLLIVESGARFARVVTVILIAAIIGLCAWDVWNRRKQGLKLVTISE